MPKKTPWAPRLPKQDKVIAKNDMRKLWLQVINAESEEELDMLEKTNVPVIQESVQTIRKLNEDEKIRALAWEREKAERNYYSEMQNAVDDGVARGKAEGIAEVIAKMRAKGMTEQEIAGILGT